MPGETVIERRDRALVAFLFLSGSRESAAISLRLGHIDLANACVHFDGASVDTKFGKSFTSGFYPIGSTAEDIVRSWIEELRREHFFSDADPLFPKTATNAKSPITGFKPRISREHPGQARLQPLRSSRQPSSRLACPHSRRTG